MSPTDADKCDCPMRGKAILMSIGCNNYYQLCAIKSVASKQNLLLAYFSIFFVLFYIFGTLYSSLTFEVHLSVAKPKHKIILNVQLSITAVLTAVGNDMQISGLSQISDLIEYKCSGIIVRCSDTDLCSDKRDLYHL